MLYEHTLQDEYYFPDWLSHAHATLGVANDNNDDVDTMVSTERSNLHEITHQTAELISNQFKYTSERLRLTNPTSDETLSDRAFFGTGMRGMTRIKLPGDDGYGYVHPMTPNDFETDGEREFFKSKLMPFKEELVRMGNQFWINEPQPVPFEEYRNRVVQVDYTISEHWNHRDIFEINSSILYLDAETRKPMGIWVAAMSRIVLPMAGSTWEHAKFYHRSTELSTMALRHVADYHIGWANSFSTALRQALPQNHGLRAFLKPYTHGSGTVNWNALQMLIIDNSILHRASGLTRRGRGFCFGHIHKHINWTKTLPEMSEEKQLDGMSNLTAEIPLFTNGMRLFDIHRRFTEGYINLIYPTDQSLQLDQDLHRFWHHLNTLGRHTNPCVCGMDDALFFDAGKWPSFETTRTCRGLLDRDEFMMEEEDEASRRQKWCKRHPIERKRALHKWLEDDCEADPKCPGLSYEYYHMRQDMGLPAEINRKLLIDVLTNFIYEVTVGHEMAADNIPYMVDPQYGGVRVLKQDNSGNLPLSVDVATYAFGTVVSALTTIRSLPLMSDWSNLLVYWMDDAVGDSVNLKRQVRRLHLDYKTELIKISNAILKEMITIPQNRWTTYMIPATQASSVAV